jgi:hypothetical protein
MIVQLSKTEGYKPYVSISASESVYKPASLDTMIKQLQTAKKWLESVVPPEPKK